jgi:phosphatidylserine/phosphatidylglycerophosphate/cardiolipin synthase-like enzyme
MISAMPRDAYADVRYCDSAWQNCRTELLRLIRAETQGIYTIQWYTRDTLVVSELKKKHAAGVPVRFIVDEKSESSSRRGVIQQIYSMRDAGIPLRHGPSKYVHGKAFIFVGQRVIQFGAPNLSELEWRPSTAYRDYRNENNEYHYQSSLVDSLITLYENLWTSSTYLRDYANMTDALRARVHPVYPKDPRWSIQPMDEFSARLIRLMDRETVGLDVNTLRLDSQVLTDALIRRRRAGLPIRINTDWDEYRAASRPNVSLMLDRLYAAGVPVKWRAHAGNNHEKVAIFHGQQVVARGSSNFSPGGDRNNSNIEINFFSNPMTNPEDREGYFAYAEKFERRWSNMQSVNSVQSIESKPFVPKSPGLSTYLAPQHASTVSTNRPRLSFKVQWAHYVDIYVRPTSSDVNVYQSLKRRVTPNSTVNVTLPALAPGSYYWRVIARTAANLTSTGPRWSFRVP